LVESRDFFIPLAFNAPVRGSPSACRNIATPFGVEKLPDGEKLT